MRIFLLAGALLLGVSAIVATASATPLSFIDTTSGYASFTALSTGTYQVLAFGAQGGSSSLGSYAGGLGAEIGGNSMLSAGEVLRVAVGSRGGDSTSVAGSGLNGSYYV